MTFFYKQAAVPGVGGSVGVNQFLPSVVWDPLASGNSGRIYTDSKDAYDALVALGGGVYYINNDGAMTVGAYDWDNIEISRHPDAVQSQVIVTCPDGVTFTHYRSADRVQWKNDGTTPVMTVTGFQVMYFDVFSALVAPDTGKAPMIQVTGTGNLLLYLFQATVGGQLGRENIDILSGGVVTCTLAFGSSVQQDSLKGAGTFVAVNADTGSKVNLPQTNLTAGVLPFPITEAALLAYAAAVSANWPAGVPTNGKAAFDDLAARRLDSFAESLNRETTANPAYQVKLSHTTNTLVNNAVYLVKWSAIVDMTEQEIGQFRIQNTTDPATYDEIDFSAEESITEFHLSGEIRIVGSGATKTFEIQYNAQSGTAGIRDARLYVLRTD